MVSEAELRGQVWESVGLFALSEIMVNDFIASYTQRLPNRLTDAVLKRQLGTADRKSALRAILDDRGFSEVYPDLVSLFGHVATKRDAVAHSRLHYAGAGWVGAIRGSEPFREDTLILANRDQVEWTATDISRFHEETQRPHGLLETLQIDLGLSVMLVGEPPRRIAGVEILGPVDPTVPREPWSLARIKEVFARYRPDDPRSESTPDP